MNKNQTEIDFLARYPNVENGVSIQVEFPKFETYVKDGGSVWIYAMTTTTEIDAEYGPTKCLCAKLANLNKHRKRFRYQVWRSEIPLTNLIVKLEAEIQAYEKQFRIWAWARCSGGTAGKFGEFYFSFVCPAEVVEFDCTTENALAVLQQSAAIELKLSEKKTGV